MTLLSPHSFAPQGKDVDRLARIAIVGRGFTGIMTAIALFKGIDRPFHLIMFDPRPKIDVGEGVNHAVATVLNSRVRDLSVDPRRRDDFQSWLEADGDWHGGLPANSAGLEHSFVPERVFGNYVYKRFAEALMARPDVVVQFLPEIVTAVDRHPQMGFSVFFGNDQRKHFDVVFLATGYGLRDSLEKPTIPVEAQSGVVIGGGVKAVGQALALLKDGKVPHINLISESGFLPQSHAQAAVGSAAAGEPIPRTLRGAFRYLRDAATRADAEGSGWQGIMNGFRLQARELWEELRPDERARFKRHVKAVYDSHRHRLPPDDYRHLHQAIESGAITLRKGKVERIASNGVLLSVSQGLEVLHADFTVDCRFRPSSNDSSLIRSVVACGLAKRDALELGLVADECGRTIAAHRSVRGLFAMGLLGLGSVADIDLVPQIVSQSHAAAASLNEWIGNVTHAVQATSV